MTTVCVPDIGDTSSVTVIEVTITKGDIISEGDTLVVLESDKASMEIPAETSGVIGEVHLTEGSEVNVGDPICELDLAGEQPREDVTNVKQPEATTNRIENELEKDNLQLVCVPDTGSTDGVTVIEVAVAVGDVVAEGDTLIVLESDKASMEIPAPADGIITALKISEGQQVTQDDPICEMTSSGEAAQSSASVAQISSSAEGEDGVTSPGSEGNSDTQDNTSTNIAASKSAEFAEVKLPSAVVSESGVIIPLALQSLGNDRQLLQSATSDVHAGPAVRALAREIGANLSLVLATGPRGRVTKDDLYNFVKTKLKESESGMGVTGGSGIPTIPIVDFEVFGPVERIPMTKIQKLTADYMTRCLLNVPAVTQFDQADITELEAFRKSMKAEAEIKGLKLTPLPFLVKASAYVLSELSQVNASIDPINDEIILKGYIHIGIAVDTPDGLVVPVIKDVNSKGIWEIAAEVADLAYRAKNKKLKSSEMQGATFTISSLGSIGGTAFTPIVPSPQAAILGVSKASIQPTWDGTSFQPRLILPICLSYDHRVINGGDGARFTTILGKLLGDIRHLLL